MGEAFKPAMVWPLAAYLAAEMEARGWNAIDVATRMPGEYTHNIGLVNVILALPDKEMRLGEGTAEALGAAFDISGQVIAGLHEGWMRHPEARQPFDCPEHLCAGLEFPEPRQ